MGTRSGVSFPMVLAYINHEKLTPVADDFDYPPHSSICLKRSKLSLEFPTIGSTTDPFDALPDDLVVSVLSKLGSSASTPADFASSLITCKRFNGLGLRPTVLAKVSVKGLAIKAKNWSESANHFLNLCTDAGNVEACYILGMIRFYCLQNRGSGASLMGKAALALHARAMFSLAVIKFNGTGGPKTNKDLRVGVALCGRAASLGHVDSLRELGHCLQDGYGVKRSVTEGRRFLLQANSRELAAVMSSRDPEKLSGSARLWLACVTESNHLEHPHGFVFLPGCPLLSDYGCNIPTPVPHPANRFLSEWFAARGGSPGEGLSICSYTGCGRPETRPHEFRRCSICGGANYCSRACQALDWKLRHKKECAALQRLPQVQVEPPIAGPDVDVAAGES